MKTNFENDSNHHDTNESSLSGSLVYTKRLLYYYWLTLNSVHRRVFFFTQAWRHYPNQTLGDHLRADTTGAGTRRRGQLVQTCDIISSLIDYFFKSWCSVLMA
jgi:hypothetical protein